ncbi:CASP8 associated protein 2 [Trebouxia sp. C0009 RCD-2024]
MEGNEDDDLYGDLVTGHTEEGQGHYRAAAEELTSKLQAKEEQMQQLQTQFEKSQAENANLTKERETLVRNISCLFKTAQLEIQRKDSELKQLKDRLSDQSKGVVRGSI